MLFEVRRAAPQGVQILRAEVALCRAAVHLERTHGGDDDDGIGGESRQAAFDVEEFLRAEICTEARLRDDVVRTGQCRLGRCDTAAPMGDVREGAAVDEGGRPLDGLHEVGLHGILKEQGQGPRRTELLRVHRASAARIADEDAPEAPLHVGEILRQTEDCHHLRGDGDVKAGLPRHAVDAPAEPRDDVAQGAVVDVEDALPHDAVHVEIECVALKDVVVDECGEKVVRRRDGVKVSRKVEVDVLHGDDLCIAAPRRAALHAEAGAERRLAQGNDGLFALPMEGIGKPDARRRLALTRGGRVDRRDEDELSLFSMGARKGFARQLCLVPAVRLDRIRINAQCGRNFCNGAKFGFARDFDIGFHDVSSLCVLRFGCLYYILHQHGDGEKSDTARHGRDRPRDSRCGVKVHVADELLRRDAVDADVDHRRALLHHVRCDKARPPDRSDEDVRRARDRGKVLRARVTDRHGCVAFEKEMRHGFSDDVAAANDDGVRPLDGDARVVEHTDAARRCAGAQSRCAEHQMSDVDGMEAVHVLARVDMGEDLLLVLRDLRGQRQLHEDAVYLRIDVQFLDAREELLLRRLGGEGNVIGTNAELLACPLLVADVDLGGGVAADDDDGKARQYARRLQLCDAACGIFLYPCGKFLARENPCHHALLYTI